MKMRKQILVAVFIAIVIVTSTAHAGLLDWFVGSPAAASVDLASSGSFGQLYASVLGSVLTEDQPVVMGNALVGMSNPVGGVGKALHRTYLVEVSGYSSAVAETDASPFITASGTHVRDGIVAANMFPFGTVIKMPKLYGDKIFVVEDRMNKRYQSNVDIWFADRDQALKLGRRLVAIEVIR